MASAILTKIEDVARQKFADLNKGFTTTNTFSIVVSKPNELVDRESIAADTNPEGCGGRLYAAWTFADLKKKMASIQFAVSENQGKTLSVTAVTGR